MRRLALLIVALVVATLGFTTSASAATTIDPANAPTGTHFQVGTATCSTNGLLVTCSSYELAGVGNTDATAALTASYQATVRCRNHGGQIVDVKSQLIPVPTTSGTIEAKNGRLAVPSLNSGPVPTSAQFEALATCPNKNWTKETLTSTITLVSFTYTLTFEGFASPFITITG